MTNQASLTVFDTNHAGNVQSDSSGLSQGGKIALIVVFGVLGGLALLVALLICCRKCCAADSKDEVDDDATLAEKEGHLDMKSKKLDDGFDSPAIGDTDTKPRRMDLMMAMFGKGNKASDSTNSDGLQGLGISDPAHQVIIVTDHDAEGTYKADESHSTDIDGSSWGSKSSSSMFYSDYESPSGSRRQTPRSEPRRRQDFLPPVRRPAPHPPVNDSLDGVRMIRSSSRSPSPDSHGSISSSLRDSMQFPSELITTAQLKQVNDETSDSLSNAEQPRLIPFTSERTVTRKSSPDRKIPSHPVLHEDVEEDDEVAADALSEKYRMSAASMPYSPPPGAGEASPIFFSTPSEGWRSPVPSDYDPGTPALGEGVRLVSHSPNASPALGYEPIWRKQQNMLLNEPAKVTVAIGEPIHFTPSLNPPPAVHISSPGRHGPP